MSVNTKAKIAERARARYEKEKRAYDAKMACRARREADGQKPRGKVPEAPDPTPKAQDQVNLTDEEPRIMPVSGGGFEQSYNAQAAVDDQTMLVVTTGVSQAPNRQIVYLDSLDSQEAIHSLMDAFAGPAADMAERDIYRALHHCLSDLPEKHRQVIYGRFGLHDKEARALEDVGARLGIPRERVRQIQREALRLLRGRLLPEQMDPERRFD